MSIQKNQCRIVFRILLFFVIIASCLLFFTILNSIFEEKEDSERQIGKDSLTHNGKNISIPLVPPSHSVNYRHKHNLGPFKYPTLGIPTPGKIYNSTKVSRKDLPSFDDKVNQLFKPYNDTNCEYTRYGDNGDGGYVMCKNFVDNLQAIVNVGINGVDNFGCAVSSIKNIPNHQYDCTNAIQPQCLTNNQNNKFHLICLGAKTEKTDSTTFFTLEDMIKIHGLANKHLLLAIDCQGGQFPGLKYFPVEKLDNIDQIVAELHFDQIYPEEWGMLDIFQTLMTKFVSVNYHMNNYACLYGKNRKLKSRAIQITLVNKKLIKLNSDSRSFKENSNNHPNGPHPDCQM